MSIVTNRFSRTRENESKLGAYYTDVRHCMDLRKLFRFPDEEVCVLEPCIGDANAVISITGAAHNPNIKIFGVELNDVVARETKENPFVTEVLKADFTCEVLIRRNSFSFCFANPPYMSQASDNGERRVRTEMIFLEKIPNYIKIGGILVWVVPERCFADISHMRLWLKHFDTLDFYRFRESEYAKYKQIAVIGRRVAKREVTASAISKLAETIQRNISELPSDLTAQIDVPSSLSEEIDLFTTIDFNADEAFDFLSSKGIPDEAKQLFGQYATQKGYADSELKRPPIPLKKDSLYLLATSGAGQGFTGSIENKDLHLQRGVAEVIEETGENYNEDGEATSITVTQRTAISMHIVENNGRITKLA